jgi:hypothetical protein
MFFWKSGSTSRFQKSGERNRISENKDDRISSLPYVKIITRVNVCSLGFSIPSGGGPRIGKFKGSRLQHPNFVHKFVGAGGDLKVLVTSVALTAALKRQFRSELMQNA